MRSRSPIAVAMLALASLTQGCRNAAPPRQQDVQQNQAVVQVPIAARHDGGAGGFAALVAAAAPAVVNIAVVQTSPAENNPLVRDPFFRRYFDAPERPRTRMAAGSGVIVDAGRGLVLTNNHVVENALAIHVVLTDRRSFTAELVGRDPPTDLAVLRLRGSNFPQIPLGNSDAAKVGDQVVAIGNPFGLGQTVTSGIISALGRGLSESGFESYIQTDAAINPGNSGGALIGMDGTIIGINSAIFGPGSNVGIGFAVPSATAQFVMGQILANGRVLRGGIGVAITDTVSPANGAAPQPGALIAAIMPGSPAARAGLRPGDVVVGVSGRATPTAMALRNQIGRTAIGTTIALKVQRGSTSMDIPVQVAAPIAGQGGSTGPAR